VKLNDGTRSIPEGGKNMKKMVWLTLTMLLVVALLLPSCQAATVEEEKETETVTGKVTEKEAAKVEEEEEEAVVEEEEGPEMVRDIKGRLVEKPRYGGTINVYEYTNPVGWDPWRQHTGGSTLYLIMGSVYDMLTGGDWSTDRSEHDFTSAYIPFKYTKGYTMESFTNPDPLTYIVSIRKGMRFDDKDPVWGREVTADDVKYSWDRILGKGEFEEDGPSPYVGVSQADPLDYIEVVDKYTFIFHMKEPYAVFPEYWGTEWISWIYPREIVDTYGADFTWEHVVGHGPWRVADFVSDTALVFEKMPTHFGRDENFPENKIPYADQLNILIIPDESTRLSALRTGKIDQYRGLNFTKSATMIEQEPQLEYIKTASVCYVTTHRWDLEPYSDRNVRKAMQMAIDLQEINDTYYGGTGDPFPTQVHPSLASIYTPWDEYSEDCQEGFTYNPDGAKAILADAGYPNGFSQTLTLSSTASTEWRELSDIFIAYWEDIGIETEIQVLESAAYTSYARGREHTGPVWIWSCGYWMPTQIMEYWYGGTAVAWNYGNIDDPVYNKYREDIFAEPSMEERNRMLKEALAYGTCEFYYTAGPSRVSYTFWQPWLKGYQGEGRLTCFGYGQILARVWVDQDLKHEMTGVRD